MPKFRFFGEQNNKSKYATGSGGVFPARVIKIMLEGESNPEVWKEYGEYQSLGAIFFSSLQNPNANPTFDSNSIAFPLFPNLTSVIILCVISTN